MPPDYKNVALEYDGSTIKITPDDATLEPGKKPKKIRWVDVGEGTTKYYWVIEFDPNKPDATKDFLDGPYEIDCNHSRVHSDKPKDNPQVDDNWPYKVSVYECVNGAKGPFKASKDPRIIWR